MEQYGKSPRASFIDYDNGDYFITICTHNKQHFFGQIVDGIMILSDTGRFLDSQLSKSNQFNNAIEVLHYVVMPNHFHAIIRVSAKKTRALIESGMIQRNPNPALRGNPTCRRHVPTLTKYVNSLKGVVTKYAKSKGLKFGWQSRYHDHMIRNLKDGNNISEYISNNVSRWHNDCFYK